MALEYQVESDSGERVSFLLDLEPSGSAPLWINRFPTEHANWFERTQILTGELIASAALASEPISVQDVAAAAALEEAGVAADRVRRVWFVREREGFAL